MDASIEQLALLNLQKDLRLQRLEHTTRELAARIARLEAALQAAGVPDPDDQAESPPD